MDIVAVNNFPILFITIGTIGLSINIMIVVPITLPHLNPDSDDPSLETKPFCCARRFLNVPEKPVVVEYPWLSLRFNYRKFSFVCDSSSVHLSNGRKIVSYLQLNDGDCRIQPSTVVPILQVPRQTWPSIQPRNRPTWQLQFVVVVVDHH